MMTNKTVEKLHLCSTKAKIGKTNNFDKIRFSLWIILFGTAGCTEVPTHPLTLDSDS